MAKKIKALCIVAHPDDELIWMGGTILANNGWEWTVYSLCRSADSDRAPKFGRACKIYKAKAIISDLDDERLQPLKISEVINKIKGNLPEKEFDYIFTHGQNGEYGHLRHREVHAAVEQMVKNKDLKCGALFFFSYVAGEEISPHDSSLKIPVADRQADWFVKLNSKIHKDKLDIITKLYGFKNETFETICSKKEEAFVVGK